MDTHELRKRAFERKLPTIVQTLGKPDVIVVGGNLWSLYVKHTGDKLICKRFSLSAKALNTLLWKDESLPKAMQEFEVDAVPGWANSLLTLVL